MFMPKIIIKPYNNMKELQMNTQKNMDSLINCFSKSLITNLNISQNI